MWHSMLTLGIETSGSTGSVCLLEDERVLAEQCLSESGRRHARALVPEIRDLLLRTGRRPHQCRHVAVSIGPGSFTGLRVGVVCAKSWAYAVEGCVTGVDSLLAVAAHSPYDVTDVEVIVDAQRGELFVGYYASIDGVWQVQAPIRLVPCDNWINSLTPGHCVSGSALAKLADNIRNRCRVLPESCWYPTARQIAQLGRRQMLAGESADLWDSVTRLSTS